MDLEGFEKLERTTTLYRTKSNPNATVGQAIFSLPVGFFGEKPTRGYAEIYWNSKKQMLYVVKTDKLGTGYSFRQSYSVSKRGKSGRMAASIPSIFKEKRIPKGSYAPLPNKPNCFVLEKLNNLEEKERLTWTVKPS